MTEIIGFVVVYSLAAIGLKHLHQRYQSAQEKARKAETAQHYTDQRSNTDQNTSRS